MRSTFHGLNDESALIIFRDPSPGTRNLRLGATASNLFGAQCGWFYCAIGHSELHDLIALRIPFIGRDEGDAIARRPCKTLFIEKGISVKYHFARLCFNNK